ncbi:MAG TPA: ABC transporter permease [Bacillota bacterium]|nr:ABC transporter permease [Bacillota bacterium]HOK71335.1 ABC transporter permease [Bacillota bacterium]HOL51721.1 ABC transporter permease [Bacillota bacterium]HOO30200.1 ABC transporter permease [Bacillota bacterium]HPZ13061.1 ABC transporter permease [Bacillota bacterium]
MGFRSYVIKRLVYALIVLYVILTLNFVLFRVMPGDPTKMIIDPNFTPEAKAELRRQYGLDDPPLKQYFTYMGNLLKFDMGLSFSTRRPVWSELKERLPNTIKLFLCTFILTSLTGMRLGVKAAANPGSFTDRVVITAGLFTNAVPTFFIQLLMLLLFGYYWPILPIHGTMSAPPPAGAWNVFLDRLWHLVLPVTSNMIVGFGSWALYARNTMTEALGQDYIVTARAKGISEKDVLYHHALRSVLPPIVTLLFMSLPGMVSGAVITESIFSWHGVGRYLLDATLQMDYPAAQGAFYLIALAVVISNLLADIAYGLVDPRIRVGAGGAK